MKRDMELIRKLVLALENEPTGYAPENLNIEGYTSEQVGYHAYLMIDAGSPQEMTRASLEARTQRQYSRA